MFIILGHTGYDTKERALTYVDSAIYMAMKYDNVYLEPGALGADRGEDVVDDFVIRMKGGGVLNKVIYGSDGVQFPGYLKSHLYSEAFEPFGVWQPLKLHTHVLLQEKVSVHFS